MSSLRWRFFRIMMFVGVISTFAIQGMSQTWTQLSALSPPLPGVGPGAYDPATNRMIVFGGDTNGCCDTNEVWVLTNANGLGGTPQWQQLAPVPDPVNGFPAPRQPWTAYDAVNNRLIIMDGCLGFCLPVATDQWVLTNANGLGGTPTWFKLSPIGSPGPRVDQVMAYDSGTNSLIVFGGQNGCCANVQTYSDTWVLSNANGLGGTPVWTQLQPTGGPPPGQDGVAGVYDQVNNRLIVMGGWPNQSTTFTNAIWVLSNANGHGGTPAWTNIIPEGAAGSPPGRRLAATVYDAGSNSMILFGGYNTASYLNDTWVLSNANGLGGTPAWTQLNPTGGPPAARIYFAEVFDPASHRMMVFGGGGPSGAFNDTWVLALLNESISITEYPAPDPLGRLAGITTGPDGNLWFVESYGNKIASITTAGTVAAEFSIPSNGIYGIGSSYGGITTGPDGNLWFPEYFGLNIGRMTTSGVATEFPTSFSFPANITTGHDGNLWFTEYYTNQIGRITPAGVITEFPLPSGGSYGAYDITAGPDDKLWFTVCRCSGGASGAPGIASITTTGTIVELPLPSGSRPSGIAAGPDGNLWFTDYSGYVGKMTPGGVLTQFPITSSDAEFITAGPDGNLWFSEGADNQIVRITTSGVMTTFPVPTSAGYPRFITAGPDGNVWFTEYTGNKIGKINIGSGGSNLGITASATKADSTNYIAGTWTNQTVTVHFTCTESGSAVATCPANQAFSVDGITPSASGTATDNFGNMATATFGPIQIDKTAPMITAIATKADSTVYAAGTWTNQTVTIHFTCSDSGSSIANCPANQVLSTDSVTASVTGTATDNAGNSANANFGPIQIDKTAPTIVATATKADSSVYISGTWTNQTVTVHFTCSDSGSGVAACPANQVFNVEGLIPTATGTATDNTGNGANATFGPVQIDKTSPTVNPVVSPNPVALNAVATASAGAADALSGIASQSCGAAVTTSTGTKSVTCTATDNAGNTSSANTNYSVTSNGGGNLTVVSGQTYNLVNDSLAGNLTMTGGTVILTNTTVTGNVQMSGGSLVLTGNSKVTGNLQINGGGTFNIGPGATIGNNLQIQSIPSSAGPSQVCGATVNGDLVFQSNGAAVLIGSIPSSSCMGNFIKGNLTVQSNSGATAVDSNTVGNNMTDHGNTGSTEVFNNAVAHSLQCTSNLSITGGGNTANQKQGQCVAF